MAGDWIKMRHCLWNHPKVVTIASRLRHACVTQESRSCHGGVTVAYAIGALACAWFVADAHADSHGVVQMTGPALDQLTGVAGLADAMAHVGWLSIRDDGSLQFLNYQEHNGSTAKMRALAQKRRQASRSRHAGVTAPSRSRHAHSVTREEKRREEDNTPQPPLQGGQQNDAAHATEQPANGAPRARRRGRETPAEARARLFRESQGQSGAAGGPTP